MTRPMSRFKVALAYCHGHNGDFTFDCVEIPAQDFPQYAALGLNQSSQNGRGSYSPAFFEGHSSLHSAVADALIQLAGIPGASSM